MNTENKHSPGNKLIITRWLIREITGVILLAVILFISAGTLSWWNGWVLVGITFVWVVSNSVILIPSNPELLKERLGPRKGTKKWDIIILSCIGIITMIRCIIAGLDYRYGWTGNVPLSLEIIMVIIVMMGYALVVWATSSNAFFANTVRIQKERKHSVVMDGPYRFVRHPGYLGAVLYELSIPVMLGSSFSLLAGLILVILVILRTAMEDHTLQNELEGYKEYTSLVRYRLLPLVW